MAKRKRSTIPIKKLGEMHRMLEKMLEGEWEKVSPNCPKRKENAHFETLPKCTLISDIDYHHYSLCCSYSNCPFL